jgi:hypothetical protein
MKKYLYAVLSVFLITTFCCYQTAKARDGSSSTVQKEPSISSLRKQVNAINTDLKKLKDQDDRTNADVLELKNQVDNIKARLDILEVAVSGLQQSTAVLNTEGTGYAIVRTKFGPFIITVEGLSQEPDGFKLKLGIGNLTNASFKEAKIMVSWIRPYDGMEDVNQWINSQGTKIIDLPNELLPGKNTSTEIILNPSNREDIKEVQVGLELDQIYLKR